MFTYESLSAWKEVLANAIDCTETVQVNGRVSAIDGDLIRVKEVCPPIGSQCQIADVACAEVVSVNNEGCMLLSYTDARKVEIGDTVTPVNGANIFVGSSMLGRVINGLGHPIDDKGPLRLDSYRPLYSATESLLRRPLIKEQLQTGIRAIDSFVSIGKGQRIGIFSGSGVGKSTLLGMIARHVKADVNVVALIGERGREVREFLEYELGTEGLRRSVVVVASSDEGPSMRIRCAHYACALSHYFKEKGNNVVLYMDSLTRVARAQREIGLLRGEMPVARGYPPSLDAVLASILERCGTGAQGNITGIFTVLVDGDDTEEPVSDIVRGLIDGHIILNRELAQRSHYPAIDILASLSRVADKLRGKDVNRAVDAIRSKLSLYEQSKDIINAGIYTEGTNPLLDAFLSAKPELDAFLMQDIEESYESTRTMERLKRLSRIV